MKTCSAFRFRRFSAIAALLFGTVSLLIFAITAGMAIAAETGKSPIRSASEIDYPPFCIVDAEGRAGGFSVELLRAALAAMGREVTFRTGTWAEVRGRLERGEVQALPLVGRTPEREALFDFTFPYMSLHGAIVVREGTPDIQDLGDLKGRRVAVMKGDNAEEFLRRGDRGIEIHTTATFEEALRELSEGRYDAVVIQRLVALRLIQQTGLTNLRVIEQPIEGFRQDFCFAVREGDRETLALLNEGLALVMADGTYRHLHAKWFAALQLPSHRSIVVGGKRNYPPFEYLDKDGLPTGFTVELTRAIAREMGMDIEIRLSPWAEIREALARGTIDVIQGMLYSPERDLQFDFTQAHTVNHCVGVVREGKGSPPATIEELADKRIVVQRGDIMHDFVLENGLGQEVTAVDTQEDALRELSEGKHDCALVSRVTALYWIKKHGWTNLIVGKKPLLAPEYCYAVPNNHKALLAQFSEGLKILEESGEYHRIYEKWLGVYEEKPLSLISLLRHLAMIVIPLLLALLAVSLWSWSLRRQVTQRTRALSESEERYRAFFENSMDAILLTAPDGSILAANPSACNLFDRTEDEIIRLGREGVVDVTDPRLPVLLAEREAHGKARGELTLIRKDGSRFPAEVTSAFFQDTLGKTKTSMIVRDMTERKRAEEALLMISLRQQALLDAVPDIIMEVDSSKTYKWANQAGLNFFGDDVIGREAADYFVGEQGTYDMVQPLFDGDENVVYIESWQRRKDGEDRLLAWWSCVLKDKSGKVSGALSTARDITEIHRAEETLRESEERYRTILETIEEGYFEVDLTGNYTFVNDAMCRIMGGYTKEEIIGTNNQSYIDSETAKKVFSIFNEVYKTGRPANIKDYEVRRKDGSFGIRELHASLMRDPEGNPIGFRGISREVTERRRAERALQESEERYRTVLESMEHGYWEVDLAGRFVFFNDAMSRILGYSCEELVGMSYRDYTTPQSQKRLYQVFNQVYRTGKPAESVDHEVISNDGRTLIFELSVSLMSDQKGNPVGFRGITRDVTKRKEMETALRESEQKYRDLIDGMNETVWVIDFDGTLLDVNNTAVELLGYSKEELLAVGLYGIDSTLKKDDIKALAGAMKSDTLQIFETSHMTKDGRTFPVEVYSSLVAYQGNPAILSIARDITDRKRVEGQLQQTLERLREAVGTTIQVMISAVEMRDPYTAGHQRRVADLARAIATEMGFTPEKIDAIRVVGSIHDIGKLSVPAEILSKPTQLAPTEFALIKEHARSGYEILKSVETDWPLAEIVYQHHERMDGSGYPRNLKGDEILIEARILAVADVVESMASHRPYRPALGIKAALEEIEKSKGILYDDTVADICLGLFRGKGYQLP